MAINYVHPKRQPCAISPTCDRVWPHAGLHNNQRKIALTADNPVTVITPNGANNIVHDCGNAPHCFCGADGR